MFFVKDDLGQIVEAIKIIRSDYSSTLLEVKNKNGIGWKPSAESRLDANKYYWYVPTKNIVNIEKSIMEIE